MVVIHERQAHAAFFPADSHRLGHVLKLAVSFVMEKPYSIVQADGQISLAVIVEVSGGTTQTTASHTKSSFLGFVLKPTTAKIVQQSARALCHTAHQKKILLPIPIVIKKTRPGARARHPMDIRSRHTPGNRQGRKSHRNRRRHIDDRVQRQLCK